MTADSSQKLPYVAPDALDKRGKALYGVPGPGRYEPATSFRCAECKQHPVTGRLSHTHRIAPASKAASGSACKGSSSCAPLSVLQHRRQVALSCHKQHQLAGLAYGCTRHTRRSELCPPCLRSLHQLAGLDNCCMRQTSCSTLFYFCYHRLPCLISLSARAAARRTPAARCSQRRKCSRPRYQFPNL